jgi:hypothetical protein
MRLLPGDILFGDHVTDGVLKAGIFGGVLLDEAVDVEDVVPEVMFVGNMFFEILVILLDSDSIDSADEAHVLLIVFDLLPLVSQLGEGIDHDAGNDIGEEKCEEDEVNGVVEELNGVPFGHAGSDHARSDQCNHAGDKGVAMLPWFFLVVDFVDVGVECRKGEDEDEENPEEGNDHQLFGVVGNG